MKLVHFICRGNSFRSRLAAAYLQSLNIPEVSVISSGTSADAHAAENGLLPSYTKHVLESHDLLAFDKGRPEQLTQTRISDDNTTIFMAQSAYDEAQASDILPKDAIIWNIPDVNELFEGVMTPDRNSPQVNLFAEQNYQRIKDKIDTTLLEQLP